jgi:NAD+ diphosphatase
MSSRNAYFYRYEDIQGNEDVLLFQDGAVLLQEDDPFWPGSVLNVIAAHNNPLLLVGSFNGRPCIAYDIDAQVDLSALAVVRISPRQLLFQRSHTEFVAIGMATQLINWVRSHRYCGQCGSPTRVHQKERAFVCNQCAERFYPRINPCVIVLVTRGQQMLLAKHARSANHLFSCLAGFMEIGETPEDTIRREVQEEVGIAVHNLRYIQSQSWPFPSQLMLGYFAEYLAGDVQADGVEILEVGWFSPDAMPPTPSAATSVAGKLIEVFLRDQSA